jgi:hypothetical protein
MRPGPCGQNFGKELRTSSPSSVLWAPSLYVLRESNMVIATDYVLLFMEGFSDCDASTGDILLTEGCITLMICDLQSIRTSRAFFISSASGLIDIIVLSRDMESFRKVIGFICT